MRSDITKTPMYTLRGLPICPWRDMSHALDTLYHDGDLKTGTLIAINAEKMLTLNADPEIKALIEDAEYCYADGISVVRSLRKKYPAARLSRVAGVDLWQALLQHTAKRQVAVFLVGGRPEILAQTEEKLRRLWQVNIVGSQHGYFSPSEQAALLARIRDSGAQLVSVALGSPRQERFMRDCRQVHPDALYMGVGGSYDVFTGQVKRAPASWQRLGLEWLYRLVAQPSRIQRQWRLWRYLYWHYSGRL